jgi:hypothetical protein
MTGRSRIFLIIVALLAVALLAIPKEVPAQDSNKKTDESREPGGSITGRVTRDGNPVAGAVVVLLVGTSHGSQDEAALARVRTDQDGRYHIADIPSGTYRVSPLLPAYVDVDTVAGGGGSVRVPSGGDVNAIDFSVVRGGVITGRVTDQSGAPLQRQGVNLYSIDDQGHARRMYGHLTGADTDDRGIYRIYSLAPGIYIASVGMDPKQTGWMGREGFYKQVFWPGVGEESKARRIKITSGSEETGVDITVGPLAKLHFATGRIISAESGTPRPNQRYEIGQLTDNGTRGSTYGSTDGAGRFRIEGLNQGQYSVSAALDGETGLYSDTQSFEVSDDNVTGLEVRVHPGATIAGSVILEGAEETGAAARLPQLDLIAWLWSSDHSIDTSSSTRYARINADGSFRFIGLRAGQFYIGLGGEKGFSLKGVQGQSVRDAPSGTSGPRQLIDVSEGQTLTGLQVVLLAATGVIRGQIRVEGGELPRGAQIDISIVRQKASFSHSRVEVDGNGRFVIDGLEPDDYTIYAYVYPRVPIPGGGYRLLESATQVVTVSNGSEASVVLILDLSEKAKKDQ